jgi:polyferredoxin
MAELESSKFTFANLDINRSKARDTGLAAALVFLLLALIYDHDLYTKIATIILVVSMVAPLLFKPLAYVWFGFAHLAGTVVSTIILTIVFFLLVVPVGIFRKLAGKDSLKLKKWKKDNASVMTLRNHTYRAADIDKPY